MEVRAGSLICWCSDQMEQKGSSFRPGGQDWEGGEVHREGPGRRPDAKGKASTIVKVGCSMTGGANSSLS